MEKEIDLFIDIFGKEKVRPGINDFINIWRMWGNNPQQRLLARELTLCAIPFGTCFTTEERAMCITFLVEEIDWIKSRHPYLLTLEDMILSRVRSGEISICEIPPIYAWRTLL